MIKLSSQSYPYLAVAQHFNVDYGDVLGYSDLMDKYYELNSFSPDDLDQTIYSPWELATVRVWIYENTRRKQVLGV